MEMLRGPLSRWLMLVVKPPLASREMLVDVRRSCRWRVGRFWRSPGWQRLQTDPSIQQAGMALDYSGIAKAPFKRQRLKRSSNGWNSTMFTKLVWSIRSFKPWHRSHEYKVEHLAGISKTFLAGRMFPLLPEGCSSCWADRGTLSKSTNSLPCRTCSCHFSEILNNLPWVLPFPLHWRCKLN